MWYGANIIEIKDGKVDLLYADGDKEVLVPSSRIRSQTFAPGEVVEINSGGKGVWYQCTIESETIEGMYTVKFKSDVIR